MKNLLSILFLLLGMQHLMAQDTIVTKEKQELVVHITEQTPQLTRFMFSDSPGGPVIAMKTNRIDKIVYKNGFVDTMGNQNPRKNRPLTINAGMALFLTEESGYYMGTLDYFILPQVNLQLNWGAQEEGDAFFSAGSEFHLSSTYSEKKLAPFTGLLAGREFGNDFLQIPIGLNYAGKNGLNIALSLNELLYLKSSSQATFVKLTLGWRFKM